MKVELTLSNTELCIEPHECSKIEDYELYIHNLVTETPEFQEDTVSIPVSWNIPERKYVIDLTRQEISEKVSQIRNIISSGKTPKIFIAFSDGYSITTENYFYDDGIVLNFVQHNFFVGEDSSEVSLIDWHIELSNNGEYTLDVDDFSWPTEAPIDDKLYGRQNSQWKEIVQGESKSEPQFFIPLVWHIDEEYPEDSYWIVDLTQEQITDIFSEIMQIHTDSGHNPKVFCVSDDTYYPVTNINYSEHSTWFTDYISFQFLQVFVIDDIGTSCNEYSVYLYSDGDSSVSENSAFNISEAPYDDKVYGMRNSEWVEVLEGELTDASVSQDGNTLTITKKSASPIVFSPSIPSVQKFEIPILIDDIWTDETPRASISIDLTQEEIAELYSQILDCISSGNTPQIEVTYFNPLYPFQSKFISFEPELDEMMIFFSGSIYDILDDPVYKGFIQIAGEILIESDGTSNGACLFLSVPIDPVTAGTHSNFVRNNGNWLAVNEIVDDDTSSDVTLQMERYKIYRYRKSTGVTSLTVEVPKNVIGGRSYTDEDKYVVEFQSGETPTVFNYSSPFGTFKWKDGIAPTIEANKYYRVEFYIPQLVAKYEVYA